MWVVQRALVADLRAQRVLVVTGEPRHHLLEMHRCVQRLLVELYDALVRIRVPNDKARAVVDAMERDMATTMTVRLGSMLMVGLGLLFAALKLT